MKLQSRKLALLALTSVLLLSISCSDGTKEDSKGKFKLYSIFLGEFKNQDEVEQFWSSLNPILWDQLRIEKIYDRNYKLYYGKFPSSFEAGKAAYNFYSSSLIKKYKISRDRKSVLDKFANVLFVSRYLDRPAVFNYNLITNQTEVEWSEYGKKVVSLNHSVDHNSVFITTAGRYKIQTGMPSLYDARVFLMKREEEQNKELAFIGNGVQLYTYWENRDTFKVNITSVDSFNSRIVTQNIFPFDINGNLGKVSNRSFDLIRDGFPAPPKRFPSEISPNNRFRFREVSSQGESYIYLRDFDDKSEQLTATAKGKIIDGRWSDGGDYLYIIAGPSKIESKKKNSGASGELIIVNAAEKKMIRVFTGFRYENLLVHGNLLFFDERSDQIAQIKVYDSKHDKIIHTITMFGGCGINNLPM